jgi:Rod binding domain-containing protein
LDAYGQFESYVLQSFLQSMLPRNATNVYGRGSAGEFWRSMLAEKMGDELARSGQVGIARRLAAGPTPSSQPGSTNTASPLTPPPSLLSTLNHVQPPFDVVVPSGDPPAPVPPAANARS